MSDIPDKLKPLAGYVEEGFIIEYLGEYYTVFGEDCPYCKEHGIEVSPSEMEITESLAIRRAIGWGYNSNNAPYTPEVKTNKIKEYMQTIIGRFVPKAPNEDNDMPLFLPDSDKVVNKIITDFPKNYKNGEIEHIIYDSDNRHYICVKQGCHKCEYSRDCVSTIQLLSNEMSIINGDFRAQEPRAFTIYRSGEPKWLEVFQNDSLRGHQKLLDYINLIFQEKVRINTDEDRKYWEFLDYHFFDTKIDLYKLNYYTDRLKNNPSNEEFKQELSDHIDYILDLWNNFQSIEEKRVEREHKKELEKH